MSDAKQAWDEVNAKFSGLSQRLKQHLEQERRDEAERGEQANRDIRAALERMTEALDDAFDALGNAAKDPEVRRDVTEAGRSLVGALGTSLDQLGDEMRRYMDRKKKASSGAGGDQAATGGEPGSAGGPSTAPPSDPPSPEGPTAGA